MTWGCTSTETFRNGKAAYLSGFKLGEINRFNYNIVAFGGHVPSCVQ